MIPGIIKSTNKTKQQKPYESKKIKNEPEMRKHWKRKQAGSDIETTMTLGNTAQARAAGAEARPGRWDELSAHELEGGRTQRGREQLSPHSSPPTPSHAAPSLLSVLLSC